MDLLITIPKTVPWGKWLDECWDTVYRGGILNYLISRDVWGKQIPRRPLSGQQDGDRCYVVHDGHIRGYHFLQYIGWLDAFTCQTTLKDWPAGYYLVRSGPFYQIKPIPCKGFRGWRYYDRDKPLKESLKKAG